MLTFGQALVELAAMGHVEWAETCRTAFRKYVTVTRLGPEADAAVIAAPTADPFGNANGLTGPAACGLLGFALADSEYADKVIVVTDNLIDFPCVPWQIQGNNVDIVTTMPAIGDASKIVSGTTQITKSPDRLRIAEMTARFVRETGIMHDGFSFQAGAGGTALSFAIFLMEMMREEGIKARFVRGGSTRYLLLVYRANGTRAASAVVDDRITTAP